MLTVIVPTTFGPHSLTAAMAAAVVQCSRTIFNYRGVSLALGNSKINTVIAKRECTLGNFV